MLPHILTKSRAELETYSRQGAVGVHYGDHRMLTRLLGEFPAFVDNRDLMLAPRLILDGYWEPWVTLAIARYLRPGMYCVDVGANYGYYTLLMAAACGPEGRVLACEPTPILAESYLPQSLAMNGFEGRVEICPAVVGDLEGEVDFVLHQGNFATSSMEPWAYANRAEVLRRPATTIDKLCVDWPRLDLVKIDAEGAESLVWEGMQETLRRFPEVVVVMELHLPRDLDRTTGLLRDIESERPLRCINYSGEVATISAWEILAKQEEHWTLWLGSGS